MRAVVALLFLVLSISPAFAAQPQDLSRTCRARAIAVLALCLTDPDNDVEECDRLGSVTYLRCIYGLHAEESIYTE